MTKLDRRSFLRSSAALGGTLFGLQGLVARNALAAAPASALAASKDDGSYGELAPTAAANTGELLLALPPGFVYTVFGRTGDLMSDGWPTPGAHDGMAAFAAADGVRLVRNHEVRTRTLGATPVAIGGVDAPAYNLFAGGGTTTLVVNPQTRLLERSFVSLSGTNVNCAGGLTPWGSWVTCEETTADLGQPHGYCFEVPADADGPVEAVPRLIAWRSTSRALRWAGRPSTGSRAAGTPTAAST